jgi:protein phosphatase
VPGDAFVLCSDGLSDLVEDPEILSVVGSEPAAQSVGKLVDLANARGGHDNVTVVVLRAREQAMGAVATVAPTVAQTVALPLPSAAQPGAPAGATIVVQPPRVEHTTEPAFPAVIPASPAPTLPPPSSSAALSARRRTNPAVMIGLTVAMLGLVLLAGVLLVHIDERGGKRNTPASQLGTHGDAQSDAPTPLAPESVVVPAPSASAPAIAPLEPSPKR